MNEKATFFELWNENVLAKSSLELESQIKDLNKHLKSGSKKRGTDDLEQIPEGFIGITDNYHGINTQKQGRDASTLMLDDSDEDDGIMVDD